MGFTLWMIKTNKDRGAVPDPAFSQSFWKGYWEMPVQKLGVTESFPGPTGQMCVVAVYG